MRRALLLGILAIGLMSMPGSAGAAHSPTSASPFAGLGAWIDIFDAATWERPERAVSDMHRRGVVTLYLQTASDRPGPAVFRPERAARFLRAAHARGMRVVAWYLPPYVRPVYELRRALGAVRFRASDGERFDAFGLDIETGENSPPVPLRNRRLLGLSAGLRRGVGRRYPLGAIVPSPEGLTLPAGRRFWPGFPYRGLLASFDAFLPMGYYTYHGRGAASAFRDTRRNIEILRRETGEPDLPIHVIGGLSGDSDLAEGRAFAQAVTRFGVLGASMYDYEEMGPEDWRPLTPLHFAPAVG